MIENPVRKMSKKASLAVMLACGLFVAYVLYSSLSLDRVSCEVCVEFRGKTACRSASGATQEEAIRAATENACAQIVSGMRDTMACTQVPPKSVNCSAKLAGGMTAEDPPPGFGSIFNGRDFAGWKVPLGDNGHWKVIDGVIDYDAESEAPQDKNLWTEKEYGDFVLRVDWRIKETPWKNPRVPIIKPDGTHKLDEHGREIQMVVPDSDSGILLRGQGKSQVNIWCWPIGSGEVYGYRMDRNMPAEVRAGVTPKLNADRNIGEWNTFEITLIGDRLTVVLNGKTVIEKAQLPEIPRRGPLALQHHGSKRNGEWTSPPSLVQFRHIFVKDLATDR